MKAYTTPCFLFFLLCSSFLAPGQIKVSDNNRLLATKDGKPFFWLGDTDWELVHRLTREEAEEFISLRAAQGFNVLQIVGLTEFNGIRHPNRYGDFPINNEDPTQLAETPGNDPNDAYAYDYWDHVDFVIRKAAEKGMYIGLLPTWGDKVTQMWGEGPVIFNEKNAEIYATTLAKRYAQDWNVIWILGGDRPAFYAANPDATRKSFDDRPIWTAMAKGIEGVLGKEAFITYHPAGGEYSTSQQIHSEPWLDINTFQSGHGARETPAWDWVKRDLALKPTKPTLDMEPCYEDHPVNPWDGKWTRARGYFTAYDVRARIYRGIFAGGCGVTYGHHHVWQFLDTTRNPPINVGDTLIAWQKAARAEAAGEMQYLKDLMLSRPYFSRIPDQNLIASARGTTYLDVIIATRDSNGSYAFIYLPQNSPVKIDISKVSGDTKNVWWFDPRTGKSAAGKSVKGNGIKSFTPPPGGKDWVLVIDDASKKFSTPGAH
jgi:hypothetical protein